MSESAILACPACAAKNRVPIERLRDAPVCGRCKQALFAGAPFEVTDASFDAKVLGTDWPTVVDFWAPWCGPCLQFAPHYAKSATVLEPHVRLAKLDTEANPAIAARYRIQSIPTLAIFAKGREVTRMSGALPANQFVKWVVDALDLST